VTTESRRGSQGVTGAFVHPSRKRDVGGENKRQKECVLTKKNRGALPVQGSEFLAGKSRSPQHGNEGRGYYTTVRLGGPRFFKKAERKRWLASIGGENVWFHIPNKHTREKNHMKVTSSSLHVV